MALATPKPSATTAPAAMPAPTTPAPAPAPAKTVYVQAPAAPAQPAVPAAPALANCGGGVSVNADTSCPFAENVDQAWLTSGSADTFSVYSPVTGLNYTMTCTGIDPVTCTGGNNALVQITF